MEDKKKIVIIVGIIIIILVVIALVGNYKNNNSNNINSNNTEIENNNSDEYIEYVDEKYGISFKYSKILQSPTIGNYSEVNLEHPKIAGSKFFYNSPDTPQLSYNEESEISQYMKTRESFGTSKLIKKEQTTISKVNPIECTCLEYVTGAFTEYIYIIPHRAGLIYFGITFPTGEPIQEFTDIIDSIISQ